MGFRNLEQISDHDPEENFETLRRLKEAFPEKVIVSSIMGRNEAEWTELARRSEQARSDIIECNFSCPQMCGNGLGCRRKRKAQKNDKQNAKNSKKIGE